MMSGAEMLQSPCAQVSSEACSEVFIAKRHTVASVRMVNPEVAQ